MLTSPKHSISNLTNVFEMRRFSRRHVISRSATSIIGTATLCSISGCTSTSLIPNEKKSIGEAVAINGIQVTFEEYTTSASVTAIIEPVQDGVEARRKEYSAPPGATYLLARFTVEHVGENARRFPKRVFGKVGNQAFKPYYRDEILDQPDLDQFADKFEVNGIVLPHYVYMLFEKGLQNEIYDGKVSGWLSNTIPENFEPSQAKYEVHYGSGKTVWGF